MGLSEIPDVETEWESFVVEQKSLEPAALPKLTFNTLHWLTPSVWCIIALRLHQLSQSYDKKYKMQ